MYETLKNKIAALEEEEVQEEEEERRYGRSKISWESVSFCGFTPCLPFTAEEAQKVVKGLEENVIHTKYIELVCFM